MTETFTATEARATVAALFHDLADAAKHGDRLHRAAREGLTKAALADEERSHARFVASLAKARHLLTQIDTSLQKLEREGLRGKGYSMPAAHPELAELSFLVKKSPARGERRGVPFHRPAASEAVASYSSAIAKALASTGESVAAQVRTADLTKAAGDATDPGDYGIDDLSPDVLVSAGMRKAAVHKVDLSIITDLLPTAIFLSGAAIAAIASRVARGLDLSRLQGLAGDPTPGAFAADVVGEALAGLGLDVPPGVAEQIQAAAVKTATARAAEMVGPGAERSIVDATRNMVKAAIVDGLKTQPEPLDAGAIADSIAALDAFSPERATLIAENELRGVNAGAAIEAYSGASLATGTIILKAWFVDPSSRFCDDCRQNEQQGPIALDAQFQSGDDAPPMHPRCPCSIEPVISASKAFHQSPQKKRLH